jgi:hypothetical protein
MRKDAGSQKRLEKRIGKRRGEWRAISPYERNYRESVWEQCKFMDMRENLFQTSKAGGNLLLGDMYVIHKLVDSKGHDLALGEILAVNYRMVSAQTSKGKSTLLKAIALACVCEDIAPDAEKSARRNSWVCPSIWR